MTLQHPTLAQQALQKFTESKHTISMTTIATKMGAQRNNVWPATLIWSFDDDTALEIKGRGKNYSVTVHLP